ncbi:MAG TPA: metal-dependent hydrolase [Methanocorpusculum sp.]|nr:metal-dependent hydrolase [Methanocorpusculum sp.]
MKITFHGHSCFTFEGTKKILTDPGENDPAKIKADITLLSHGHTDHMGTHPEKYGRTFAIHELACFLGSLGVKTTGMNIGGAAKEDDITIRLVPALHSSSIPGENGPVYMGEPCGFVFTMDGKTIYFAGDTGLFSDMKLIGELYHPDIAILPAGGLYTMGPEEAMIAAEYIGAPLVIPMHYNTFPPIRQNLTEFKRAVELTGAKKVMLMQPGESVEV